MKIKKVIRIISAIIYRIRYAWWNKELLFSHSMSLKEKLKFLFTEFHDYEEEC